MNFFFFTYIHRCDEKLQKKLMSYLEITDADGSETAPAELEERITQLTEQLELKGHEVKKLETNMEEVTGAKHSVKELFMQLEVATATSICIYMYFCSGLPMFCCWCFSLCHECVSKTTPHFPVTPALPVWLLPAPLFIWRMRCAPAAVKPRLLKHHPLF